MQDPLATYLHDHLAGASFAIDLIKSIEEQYSGQPLGTFAATLLGEIREDQLALQGLADRVGDTDMDLKEAAAWLAGKLSHFKLRRDLAGELGTFEALETLALGILGKLSLWRALSLLSGQDPRLSGVDFERLAEQAHSQHDRVEAHRLELVQRALYQKS
jgi:hypothetical protein